MGNERTVVSGRMDMAGLLGPLWFWGWLFTIGYLHLHIVKIVLGIVLWPYFLGAALAK